MKCSCAPRCAATLATLAACCGAVARTASQAAFLFFGIDFGFEPLAPGEGPEAPPLEAEAPPTLAASPPSPLTGDGNPTYMAHEPR